MRVLKQVGRFLANKAICWVVRHGTRKHDPLAEGSDKAVERGRRASRRGPSGTQLGEKMDLRSRSMARCDPRLRWGMANRRGSSGRIWTNLEPCLAHPPAFP